MSLRVIILALFFAVGLLPQGWNKFDNTLHASLLYGLGALLMVMLFLSWKEILKQKFETIKLFSTSNGIKISAITLSILLVVSFAVSPIQNYGWSEVMVMVAGIGLFFMVQTFTEKERKDFVHVVLALALACAALGLAQYLFRPENRIAGPLYESSFKANYWPNAFALMLLMCWPLAFTINFNRTYDITLGKRTFVVNLGPLAKSLAAATLISALILTFSRAAFLVFMAQLVVCIYFIRTPLVQLVTFKRLSSDDKKTFTTLFAAVIATILITLTFQTIRASITSQNTSSFISKATFAGTEQQTSFLERAQFMEGALRLIPEHPFLGSGPFSFRFIYPKIQPDFLAVSDHPHNWYLKIALEEGIPAALAFITLLACIAWFRRDLLKQKGITFSAILALSLMGPIIHNLADYNMNFLTNQILFWTFLGFLVAEKSRERTADLSEKNIHLWPSILALVVTFTGVGLLFEGIYSISHRYELMQFPRGYFHGQARYEVTQANTEKATGLLLHHLSLNSYDAFAWNYLGQIQEHMNPEEALKNYANAIKSDPANFFSFYIDYIRLAKGLKKTNTETYKIISKKAHDFLVTYPEKVRTNIHFTARTANAKDAIELAKLLGDLKLSLRIERALRLFNQERSQTQALPTSEV